MLTFFALFSVSAALKVVQTISSRESVDSLTQLEVMVGDTDTDGAAGSEVVAGGVHTWQEAIEAEDICKDGLEMIYVEALKDVRFDECESLSVRAILMIRKGKGSCLLSSFLKLLVVLLCLVCVRSS